MSHLLVSNLWTLLWVFGLIASVFLFGAGPPLFAWWWYEGRHLPKHRRQAVLDALAFGEELYGRDIVERSDGLLREGTVYVLLDRMEDEGLIESRLSNAPPGLLPRRMYRRACVPIPPEDQLRELRSLQSDPNNILLLRLLWEAGGMEVEASSAAMAERELCEKAYELLSGKRWAAGRPCRGRDL